MKRKAMEEGRSGFYEKGNLAFFMPGGCQWA